MDKQANRIVELSRIPFPHLVGQKPEQNQKDSRARQPDHQGCAQPRKQGWSIHCGCAHGMSMQPATGAITLRALDRPDTPLE